MKKASYIFYLIIFLSVHYVNAQTKENHGNVINTFLKIGYKAKVSINYEIQIINNLTIAPTILIPLDFDIFNISLGARADYYFDDLIKLPEIWDIYSGIEAKIMINGDDFNFNIHAGTEYRFHKRWGVIAEFGAGSELTGGIGMAFHL